MSSEYISGFALYHFIVKILLLKDKSISSSSIHAIGAKTIISYGVSNISTATCHTSSCNSFSIYISPSEPIFLSSVVTQNNLNIIFFYKNIKIIIFIISFFEKIQEK